MFEKNIFLENYSQSNPNFSILHGMEMAWKILEDRFKILKKNCGRQVQNIEGKIFLFLPRELKIALNNREI